MKKLAILVTALALLVVAVPALAKSDNAAVKVDICHLEGNGSYHMISVSENAIPAHEEHGDAYPGDVVGDKVLGEDCSLVEPPILVVSSVLNFSNTGWGGWSCPSSHPNVVDGGVSKTNTQPWEPADYLYSQVLAVPGATLDGYTYPVFPHWTYNTYPGETGLAVHNGGTGQSLYVYVYCGL